MFEEMLNSEEKINEESDDKVIDKSEVTKFIFVSRQICWISTGTKMEFNQNIKDFR